VIAAVHITKDISWRKKWEEELIRNEKLDSIAVLAGGIAHDFNNMLTIIMSTTTLAKMYAKDDARVVAKIDEAEQEIIRTRELTNQLLTFAKGGAPVRRLSSFEDLLRDTVEFSVKGSNVRSDLIVADGLWAAEIDHIQISQVFSNLVINAVQSMQKGGTIRVRADNADLDERDGLPLLFGRYVRIAFEDSGTGIAAEDMAKIFDPFFTTKTGGSGLGLSISYSIVKKHGGYIEVRSQPGAGSTFTVYLPASLETPAREPAAVIAELKGSGRVLLMDDDTKLLNTVAEMLTNSGYEVETARNGEEALILYKRSMVQARPFDAVVLDVTVVGGMGGKDCMQHLTGLDPSVRAIVMSGYSEDAVLADYRSYGFRELLSKPFTIDEIKAKLQSVITGTEGNDASDPRR
jgi:nitrogen-specific signal transduction histidine kinase/ActR/RegA family two-component response regulator